MGSGDTNFGAARGLGALSIFLNGDFSWPPSGEEDFSSVGSLMGPNGETPSWSLSHDPKLGALGGFEGFQGTDVVFIIEERGRGFSLAVVRGKREKEPWEERPGSRVGLG